MSVPLIALLTDFGRGGPYIGALRGAVLQRCRDAHLVDVTHSVPPHDILAASFVLAAAAPYFPWGTIFLAVVDPGVGGPRRAIAARGRGRVYIGPDNGIFTLLEDDGEIRDWREIDPELFNLGPVSPTFHGRDLFAPVAGVLASGLPFEKVGAAIVDPVRLPLAEPHVEGNELVLQALHVDSFGNVTMHVKGPELRALLEGTGASGIEVPGRGPARCVRTYSEGPKDGPFFLWGSSGRLELAMDRRSAAERLGIVAGTELRFPLVLKDRASS